MLLALLLGVVSVSLTGPENCKAGDLVVLDGSNSVGESFRWVAPDGLPTMVSEDHKLAFTAPGNVTELTFFLVAADKDAGIAVGTTTVKVAPRVNAAKLSGAIVATVGDDPESQRWLKEMLPQMAKVGWVVQVRQTNQPNEPMKFSVEWPNSKVVNSVGYLSTEELAKLRDVAYAVSK